MSSKINFGKWEAIYVLVLITCTQIFLNMPRLVVEYAATAGWLLVIYVSILCFIVLWVILKLYKDFEGMDLIDLAEYLAGRAGKIIVGIVLSLYMLFISFVILREFSENMKIIALPLSPISYTSIFFVIGMVVAAYFGLEAMVRINAIAMPIIIISYILILIGISDHFNVTRLAPYLGFGAYNLFVENIPRISLLSGIISIFYMAPFLKPYKVIKEVGYTGLLISAVMLTIASLSYLLIFTYPIATENFLPIYQLSRIFSYGRFFERFESIFLIVWAVSAFLYLSMISFFTIYYIKKAFDLEYYRPLIIPVAIIIFNLSLIPPNLMTAIELENNYFRSYSGIVSFVFPLLLLLACSIKRKLRSKRRRKEKHNEQA